LRGWNACLAAATLGALSALALPPTFILPILLLTVPGLLFLLDAGGGVRRGAVLGFWFGFGHHMLGLYWVTDAILLRAAQYWWLVPFAVPGLAVLLAPFIALACALACCAAPGWRRVLLLGGGWVIGDLLREFVLGGFPWNPWGSMWAFPGLLGTAMIQPASWIGVPGLTLVTVLLAASPYLGRRFVALGAAALAFWAALGLARLSRPRLPATDVAAVLVQGDVAEASKWSQAIAGRIFFRYLRLTAQGVAAAEARYPGKRIVVVWPETASPYLLEQDPGARQAVMQAAHGATAALVGSITYPDGNFHRRPRNSLVALEGDGKVLGTYDKWHLVPFGEYQPDWVPVPIQLVPANLAPGVGPRTLRIPGVPPFGPLICYEAIFPGEVVNRADRPSWMINITNDAWFGNSSGPRQHLVAARLRAVEEGLPLLRAANTGISAGFDARGRVLGRLGLDRTGDLVLQLPGALPATPFGRYGLAIPGLLALAAIGGGLDLARKRRVGSRIS
jgi:apolipoprotein N-acyltransferase